MDTNIDFSNEDWGKSVKFYDDCRVITETHNPALNFSFQVLDGLRYTKTITT